MNFGQIGYCPFCGTELSILSIAPQSGNTMWNQCHGHCRGSHTRFVTDEQGFLIEPFAFEGKYLLSRPIKESANEEFM